MDNAQRRALAKVRRCLDLAADTRGNATERETAWRQAQVLIEKHRLQLDRLDPQAVSAPAPPERPPHHSSAEFAPYWAQRTTEQAMEAGVLTRVLCRDGWLVPG